MKAFDYSLVKDPQYFCDNRMEAHSDHVYPFFQEAGSEGIGFMLLDGVWDSAGRSSHRNMRSGERRIQTELLL